VRGNLAYTVQEEKLKEGDGETLRYLSRKGLLSFDYFLDYYVGWWRKGEKKKKQFEAALKKALQGEGFREPKKQLKQMKECLNGYDISYDVVKHEVSDNDLCDIFEKINSTGTKLNIFDLKVADFKDKGVNLRNLWKIAKEENPDFEWNIFDIDPVYILKTIALVKKSKGRPEEKVTCQKRNIDELPDFYEAENIQKDFNGDWKNAVKWLRSAIEGYKSNYGVARATKVPYAPMLIVYAAILWWNDENTKLNDIAINEKLSFWYWCSVFSKRYDKSTDDRVAEDFKLLRQWLLGKIDGIEKIIQPYRKISLMELSNRDAIYKGILCLPSANGAKDLFDTKYQSNLEVEDHHIFPRKWLEDHGFNIKGKKANCVLNRTYILANKNSAIGRKAPDKYFKEQCDEVYSDKLDYNKKEDFKKHFIDNEALEYVRKNDFRKFLERREELIWAEIKSKTKTGGESL